MSGGNKFYFYFACKGEVVHEIASWKVHNFFLGLKKWEKSCNVFPSCLDYTSAKKIWREKNIKRTLIFTFEKHF